jgi:hypothetical protein
MFRKKLTGKKLREWSPKISANEVLFLERIYSSAGMAVINELVAIMIKELTVIGGNMNKERKPLTPSNRSHGNPSVHAIFLSL